MPDSERRTGAELDLLKESYLSFLAGIVASPLPLVTVALLAVYLSPSELGVYYFVLASIMVARRPVDGFVNTMRKRGTESGTNLSEYFGWSLLLSSVFVAITGFLMVVLSGFISSHIFLTPNQIYAGAILLFALSAMIIGTRLQDSIGDPAIAGWMLTARDVAFIPVIITLGAVFGLQSATLYLFGYAFISLGVGIVGIARAQVKPARPSEEVWEKGIQFSKWEVPNTFFSHLFSRLPAIITGLAIGSVAVGVFESGAQPTMFIPFLAVAVADPLMLKISGKTSEGTEINSEILTALTAASFAPLLFFSLLVGVGYTAVELLFQGPSSTIWIIALIMAGARWAYALRMVFSRALRGADSPDEVSTVIAAGAILGAVLLTIGAYLAGAVGIAITFAIAQLAVCVELGRRVQEKFELVSLWEPLMGHQLVSAVITVVILGGYRFRFGIESVVELALTSVAGFVIFGTLLILLNYRVRNATRKMVLITMEILESA